MNSQFDGLHTYTADWQRPLFESAFRTISLLNFSDFGCLRPHSDLHRREAAPYTLQQRQQIAETTARESGSILDN